MVLTAIWIESQCSRLSSAKLTSTRRSWVHGGLGELDNLATLYALLATLVCELVILGGKDWGPHCQAGIREVDPVEIALRVRHRVGREPPGTSTLPHLASRPRAKAQLALQSHCDQGPSAGGLGQLPRWLYIVLYILIVRNPFGLQ